MTESVKISNAPSLLNRFGESLGLVAVLLVVIGVFSLFSDRFLSAATFNSIANQVPALAVVAVGMTFVIITAGIDLSVGSVLGFAGAVLGVAMFAILVPLSLLMRPPPKLSLAAQSAHAASGGNYLPARTVMIFMSVAILLCCTCMSVPLMHLVPLIQGCGFALDQASSVLFTMLLVAIAGRVTFGKLADIIGALPAYMTATAWMTLLVFGFTQLESLGLFYGYAIVYGFGYAGVMTGVLVTIAALTHPSRRATVMGVVTMFGWFGHANGGYLGGWLYDLTSSYNEAYAFAAAAGILNLMVVATLYMKTRQSGPLLASA